jgi:hypothetical protein
MLVALSLGVAAACSPASPIAPDPGPVNIPGLPANTGEVPVLPAENPTPTPKPSRSVRPSPTPVPTPLPTPTPTPRPTPTPQVSTSPDTPAGAKAFKAALAAKGIILTEDQLESIRASITVRPSGEWGTKGEFSPDETLADDFSRYKLRFTPTHQDVKSYRSAAIAFAGSRTGDFYLDVQFFQKFEQPLVAKWDEKTRRFLVITSDGAVSTYTAVASLAPARYVPVPDDL